MARRLHWLAEEQAERELQTQRGQGDQGHNFAWKVIDDGNDAVLLSGKMQGSTVRELVATEEGKRYLAWVYQCGPAELRRIVEGYFEG
jgi:hypothetical protein